MTNKKRKINSSILIICILTVLVLLGFKLLTSNPSFWFKKSIHADALKYSTRHCLVFYPKNKRGKEVAKQLAKECNEDRIYDYSLIPYGDYFYVSYGNGVGYFVDKDNNSLVINDVSDYGKRIIGDYLRYTIKKEKPDLYYDSKFLESTCVDKLDFSNVTYDIEDEYLKCYFPTYDINALVPLKYMQTELNMNFGFKDELYSKPIYIDTNHPVICLTFDDGPQFWYEPNESSSNNIVNTLYKYDVNATFYVVGECLDERDSWTDYQVYTFLKQSINNGNEYGSHTHYHDELVNISSTDKIKETISYPGEYLNDLLGYQMKTYRPPEGLIDDTVLSAQPYPAIFWDIDSEDWKSRDANVIYDKVLSYANENKLSDGDIILFHEIYDETAKAIEKIVPELVDRGYQLVTVSDMLKYLGIDVNNLSYYYNFIPPNYE